MTALFDKFLVVDTMQLIVNERYIYVHYIDGKISFEEITVTSEPYAEKLTRGDAYFVNCTTHYPTWDYEGDSFSVDDANIVPNHYNNHSIWLCTDESRNYLHSLAVEEYHATMKRWGRYSKSGLTSHKWRC